jgi:hypothetical protein
VPNVNLLSRYMLLWYIMTSNAVPAWFEREKRGTGRNDYQFGGKDSIWTLMISKKQEF